MLYKRAGNDVFARERVIARQACADLAIPDELVEGVALVLAEYRREITAALLQEKRKRK